MSMNNSIDNAYQASNKNDTPNTAMPSWSEDDMEEILVETPWELFSFELDNWDVINNHSARF